MLEEALLNARAKGAVQEWSPMVHYVLMFQPKKRKVFDKNLKLFIRGIKDSKYLITDV